MEVTHRVALIIFFFFFFCHRQDPFGGEGAEGLAKRAAYVGSFTHVYDLTKATGLLTEEELTHLHQVFDSVTTKHDHQAYR
jgi:hypothetical protein